MLLRCDHLFCKVTTFLSAWLIHYVPRLAIIDIQMIRLLKIRVINILTVENSDPKEV